MKRNERRLLEEQISSVTMQHITLSEERANALRARAKEQFDRLEDAQPQKEHPKSRRVILVIAAAMSILVCSFVFAVVMPQPVSSANGFLRRAAIWVNDTFHLGYVFETPVDDVDLLALQNTSFSTLEEVAAFISRPLVALQSPELTLESITIDTFSTTNFFDIFATYRCDTATLVLWISPTGDDSVARLKDGSETIVSWQEGELLCWYNETFGRAVTNYHGMQINITGDCSYDDFVKLCTTLAPIN